MRFPLVLPLVIVVSRFHFLHLRMFWDGAGGVTSRAEATVPSGARRSSSSARPCGNVSGSWTPPPPSAVRLAGICEHGTAGAWIRGIDGMADIGPPSKASWRLRGLGTGAQEAVFIVWATSVLLCLDAQVQVPMSAGIIVRFCGASAAPPECKFCGTREAL